MSEKSRGKTADAATVAVLQVPAGVCALALALACATIALSAGAAQAAQFPWYGGTLGTNGWQLAANPGASPLAASDLQGAPYTDYQLLDNAVDGDLNSSVLGDHCKPVLQPVAASAVRRRELRRQQLQLVAVDERLPQRRQCVRQSALREAQ